MTADEKMARIRVKFNWAMGHFRRLKVISQEFLDTKPYAFGSRNADSGHTEHYLLKDAEVPPPEIGLLAGDVAHNLRSALDHLAFQLWLTSSLHTGNGKHVYFPIFDNADKCKKSDGRKVQGMTKESIAAIMATEPYRGGEGELLWILNELDIADKHHTLVTSSIRATKLAFGNPVGGQSSATTDRPHGLGFTFSGFRAPAKAGDVIATFERKIFFDVKPVFDIAVSEPEVVEGQSVIVTLQDLIWAVHDLLLKFTPLLA